MSPHSHRQGDSLIATETEDAGNAAAARANITRSKRLRYAVLAVIAIAAASWFGYGYYLRQPTVFEGPALKFTASACHHSSGVSSVPASDGEQPGRGYPEEEGVKSIMWRDDGTLRVVALMIENCAAHVKDGGYSVHGGTIYLAYNAVVDKRAACNCAYHLTYDVSGVPRANYDVYFPTTGKMIP